MTNVVTTISISNRTTAATTRPITRPDGPGSLRSAGDDVVVIVSDGRCKICLATIAMSAILSLISRL